MCLLCMHSQHMEHSQYTHILSRRTYKYSSIRMRVGFATLRSNTRKTWFDRSHTHTQTHIYVCLCLYVRLYDAYAIQVHLQSESQIFQRNHCIYKSVDGFIHFIFCSSMPLSDIFEHNLIYKS